MTTQLLTPAADAAELVTLGLLDLVEDDDCPALLRVVAGRLLSKAALIEECAR